MMINSLFLMTILLTVFDDQLSSKTMEVIQKSPARLRAVLILGSPEMMKR